MKYVAIFVIIFLHAAFFQCGLTCVKITVTGSFQCLLEYGVTVTTKSLQSNVVARLWQKLVWYNFWWRSMNPR